MLEFIYASMARRNEVADLDVTDLFLTGEPYATIRNGKGNRDRLVLLGARFVKAWTEYLPVRQREILRWENPKEQAAFVNRRTGRRADGQSVYWTVKKLCKLAGIRELYPHAIRHSGATHMLNRGADLMDLKEQLGHSSLATTQVYLHVALERRRAQYQKSHPAAGERPSS
jgi:site-specific recombinase XerD